VVYAGLTLLACAAAGLLWLGLVARVRASQHGDLFG
jgi:hypothetical protein